MTPSRMTVDTEVLHMPRYRFYTTVGSATARDDGAFELDDLDAARRKAEEIRRAEAAAAPQSSVNVEVRDEAGQLLHAIVHVR